MKTLLTLTLVAATIPLVVNLTGCLGCSGYTGGNDVVYSRDADSLTICENGGFVAVVSGATIEGYYYPNDNRYQSDPVGTGVRGDNGQIAFDLDDSNSDGMFTTPQLPGDAWQILTLNQTELDHANIPCTDLESRSWWTSSPPPAP